MQIPPSVTIAELEMEARRASAAAAESVAKAESAKGGGSGAVAGKDDLIVLRKDDLNSILTAKPTLLIGREISVRKT